MEELDRRARYRHWKRKRMIRGYGVACRIINLVLEELRHHED